MGAKTVSCYGFDLMLNNRKCETKLFKEVLEKLIAKQGIYNKTLVYSNTEDKTDYISLDLLRNNDKYIFIRIGKNKDIDGVMKRDKHTLIGEEVFNEQEKQSYELEICTYFLIDYNKGIILTLDGLYAPTINSLKRAINEVSSDFKINYNHILSDDMIEILKHRGKKLNKIEYKYEIPDIEILENLGLTTPQIVALQDLECLELEISIRNKPKIPLTSASAKIKHVVESFNMLSKPIRESVKLYGKTEKTSTKAYKFTEQNVNFKIDISSYMTEDGKKYAYSLEALAEQIYDKLKYTYEDNKLEILKYAEK